MAYTKGAAPKTPPKKGTITAVLDIKNIGIDNKTLMLIDDRVAMVRDMNLQIGEVVDYRQLSQGMDKGKINFLARSEGAGPAPVAHPNPEQPTSASATPKETLETQDIQAEFVSEKQMKITLKDCVGEEQVFRGDLDVIKLIVKPDSQVKPGQKYKFHLVKKEQEWIITRIGPFKEDQGEKPFRTGSEILKQNLDQKKAETEKAQAALDQINNEEAAKEESPSDKFCAHCQTKDDCKSHSVEYGPGCALKIKGIMTKEKEDAAGDARIKENEQEVKSLVGATKPMTKPEPTKEPENVSQNEAVTPTDIAGAVGLKIHINLGSFCNFDLSVEGQSGEHARQLLAQEASKSIPLVANIMREAMKVSQQVRY